MPSAQESLANMKLTIEGHLDASSRKEFNNAVNGLTRLGNRKPKLVEPRRQKIREIVSENENIVDLYKVYATAQRAVEKRLTFQLPLLPETRAQEEGDMSGDEALIAMLEPDPESLEDARERLVTETRAHAARLIEDMQRLNEAELRTAPAPKTSTTSGQHDCRPSEPRTDHYMAFGIPIPNPAVGPDRAIQRRDRGRNVDDELSLYRDEDEKNENKCTAPENMVMMDMISPKGDARSDAASGSPRLRCAVDTNAVQADITAIDETDKHIALSIWSGPLTDDHIYLTPVTNPEMFPMERTQVVQSQYYPSAKIVSMWTHRDCNGGIGQVTADMQDGPVNHILLKDARIVAALGLLDGANDTISLRDDTFKIHETFVISVLLNQRTKNLKTFVVGALQSARHAFLHWLDYRGSSDPKRPPYVQEVRHIAMLLGRRATDVWKEIDGYWELEQGSGGSMYRKNRVKYLGEDPTYDEETKAKKPRVLSMWG